MVIFRKEHIHRKTKTMSRTIQTTKSLKTHSLVFHSPTREKPLSWSYMLQKKYVHIGGRVILTANYTDLHVR